MVPRKRGHVILLFAFALLASLGGPVLAQESGALPRVLDAADLSPESKALLRERAVEAVRAGVAEIEVAGLIRRGMGQGVQAPDIARFLDVVAEAKRQDLPVGPVLDKVKEGLAKRVPADRVLGVTSRISGDLATSRDLVHRAEREGVRVGRAGDRERAIEAVADALGRGVSRNEIEDLARHVTRSSRREATMSRLETGAQITADLISVGLSPRDAAETVGAALSHGQSKREIEGLREGIGRELKRGRSLEEGARRLREEIRSGRGDERSGRNRDDDRDRLEQDRSGRDRDRDRDRLERDRSDRDLRDRERPDRDRSGRDGREGKGDRSGRD